MLKAKRKISWILLMVMVLVLLTACSGGDTASTSSATTTVAGATTESAKDSSAANETSDSDAVASTAGSQESELVNLTVCTSQTGWGGSIDPDLMEAFKTSVEEATNTQIDMIAPPHNDYREKLNVLLSSGDIPDLFMVQLALDNVPVYAVRGYIAPIDDYLTNNEFLNQNLSLVDTSAFEVQGQLYALPQNRVFAKIFLARQDAVEKYGLELKDEMTTQEFFDEMLKVDQDEAIPFCFPKWTENFQIFYGPFGAYAGILPDDSGKYYDGFQTDEIKDAILYIKDLYDAGIFDKEFITNENAMMREKFYTGKAVSMADYYYNYVQMMMQADGVDNFTELVPVYTLIGPDGKKGNLNEAAQNAMCVSASAENKQRAVDVMAYWHYSEDGAIRTRVGIEGYHYTVEDNIIVPTEKAENSGFTLNPGGFTQAIPIISELPFSWGGIGEEYYAQQVSVMENSVKDGVLGEKFTPPSGVSELYDRNAAGYLQNIKEIATKIVLGNSTVEQAFAEYDTYWKSIQGDEMLEQLNAG